MIVEGPLVPVGARQAWQLTCRFDLAGLAAEARVAGDRTCAATYEALVELAKRWATNQSASASGSEVAEVPEVGVRFTSDVVGSAEVARVTGVSPRAVTLAAAAGRLHGRKDGRDWRFDVVDVHDWIARRAG